jgi:hypothetical protein
MTTKPGDIAAAAIAFMESKLIEWEDAAALGDTDASGEFLGRQGRPRRNPAQGAQPWSIHAKPRWDAPNNARPHRRSK